MIDLISTPEYVEQTSPEIISRWVATESPNNFRLLRHDFDIVSVVNNAGYLQITVAAASYDGQVGNSISVFNKTLNAMYLGTVLTGSTSTVIETDIPFLTGFDPSDTALDPERDFTYFNDNTSRAGYYFEGRLTVNGVVNPLTIIASPDSFGYADLDVSGVLRIVTTLGKTGDYSSMIIAETNKSGNFSLEYRDCWYTELSNAWTPAGGSPAPLWYYAEAVRSEEQGSNLHEYEPDDANAAPFFNAFETPVYFAGLPFDISFILPERSDLAPGDNLTVTLRTYSAMNLMLSETTSNVVVGTLEGHVCSLTIDPTGIESIASYFTVEISA